jgi:hypothetical protein
MDDMHDGDDEMMMVMLLMMMPATACRRSVLLHCNKTQHPGIAPTFQDQVCWLQIWDPGSDPGPITLLPYGATTLKVFEIVANLLEQRSLLLPLPESSGRGTGPMALLLCNDGLNG